MITLEPIGYVRSPRVEVTDDYWGDVVSRIELAEGLAPESLDGLEEYSHAEIFFHFHLAPEAAIEWRSRHPRGNTAWPRVGIFAIRSKSRPNRLGATIVEIVAREGATLVVRGLDAVDGAPVVDIKPVLAEFLPRSAVRQPEWTKELMRDYWK